MTQTVDELSKKLYSYGITDYCAAALAQYVLFGIPPGGFLKAVLSNDFFAASGRADVWNQKLLWNYANAIQNELDPRCYGSAEVIQEWTKHKGLKGLENAS